MLEPERSLEELTQDDPERADAVVFARRTDSNQRGFADGAGVATVSAAVGARIPFAAAMPAGLVPATMVHEVGPETGESQPLHRLGKPAGLRILSDRPIVAETPEQLLDDDTTPTDRFFVRNNGLPPEPSGEPDAWAIRIEGEVNSPLQLTLEEIKRRFASKTYRMVLECGGNGRSGFSPRTGGNQWTNGGVGCAEWTGVPLADLLRAAGLKETARFTAHHGSDLPISGAAGEEPLSRGMPIAKAMEEHGLVVFGMNGQPLPHVHGGPVRLVIPGWPGSLSHKWLRRIGIRDREHDGPGMTGTAYRVAVRPMIPGGTTDERNLRVLESMPVRSIVTRPANGVRLPAGIRELPVRGAAWAGDGEVARVDVSIDFGATWRPASMAPPRNRYDWRRWTARVPLPSDGYFEVWSRATDADGRAQPHVVGHWNPGGFGGNAMHRVAVVVG